MQCIISADKGSAEGKLRPDGAFRDIARMPPTPYPGDPALAYDPTVPDDEQEGFDWCHDSLLIEFKTSTAHDPFHTRAEIEKKGKLAVDRKVVFERDTQRARRVRGQLALYAAEMFGHQQRTHLFQILIMGTYARFIRWDRSGIIASERFDYTNHPMILAEFLWRHNHMSDEVKGWDVTAKVASPAENDVFMDRVRQYFGDAEDPTSVQRKHPRAKEITIEGRYPVHRIEVKGIDKDGNKAEMNLLIRKPFFKVKSALGRGTRGYVAVQADTREVWFMKDTWRVNWKLLETETQVYRLLEAYGVPHIPRLICGGDVMDSAGNPQMTKTLEAALNQDCPVAFNDMRVHTHHRIVQPIAFPVESAEDSKEYVLAFYDVILGKCSCYSWYRRRHLS